jgi:hypothetical protein
MAETTAVRKPSGASPKMTLSRKPVLSLRNCLVTCSPKRVMSGARSVAKLSAKSDQGEGQSEEVQAVAEWLPR